MKLILDMNLRDFPVNRLYYCLLLICSLLIVSRCQKQKQDQPANSINPDNLPYKFEIINKRLFVSYVIVADLNGDGISESLTIAQSENGKNFVTISDYNLTKSGPQLNFSGYIHVKCFDIENDGKMEIFISERINNKIIMNIFNHAGTLIKRFPVFKNNNKNLNNETWDCVVKPAGLIDGNNDGIVDLIFIAHTGYAYQPRGIWVFDYQSGNEIWRFETGAVVADIRVSDLNEDGKDEIVMDTEAPGNGEEIEVNGTNDFNTYLIILDNLGNVIEKQKMGRIRSTVCTFVNDMNQDGQAEILILKRDRNMNNFNQNVIAFWNFEKGIKYRERVFERQISENILFYDYDDDGIKEFLMPWLDGHLDIRNIENKSVHTYNLGEMPQSGNMYFADLNFDGEKELIICGTANLFIFTKTLKLMGKFPIDSPTIQIIDRGPGVDKFILLNSASRYYYLVLQSNYKKYIYFTWPYFLILIVGISIGFIGFKILNIYKTKHLVNLVSQNFLNHLNQGVIVLNDSGEVININPYAKRLLGLTNVFLNSPHFKNLFNEPTFEFFHTLLDHYFTNQLKKLKHYSKFQHDGIEKDIIITLNPIQDNEKKDRKLLITIEDITLNRQSERAIAWAVVAQRLAHQIKTPISSIMLAIQRLQMEYKKDGIAKAYVYDRYVDYVSNEIVRLRQATDDFMKLSQLEKPVLHPCDINLIINECLEKYKDHIGSDIQMETDFASNIPLIEVDDNQIRVAFQIIIDNSIQAIKEKGSITITTRQAQTLQDSDSSLELNYIQIEIADTGEGISKDVQQQLFTPFLTTKKNGTGLGLTIAKKIIEDHEGTIEIRSDEGIGTIVILKIPIS